MSLNKSFFDSYLSLLNYLKSNNYAYEYRTTIIKKFHTQDDILAICQSLEWISNFYLQNYVSWNTLDSNFKGESFYENELVELKNLCLQYVWKCEIRR